MRYPFRIHYELLALDAGSKKLLIKTFKEQKIRLIVRKYIKQFVVIEKKKEIRICIKYLQVFIA